jgi:hypothetical protein
MIKLKRKEFQDWRQGSMLVNEYVTHVTQLSLYTLTDVDTDEKKYDWFINGLNDGLAYALEARNYDNFHNMVNKALVLENRRGIMDPKRNQERLGQSSNNSRPRVGVPFTGPMQRTPQQQPRTQLQQRPQVTMQGYQTPQCHFTQCPNFT